MAKTAQWRMEDVPNLSGRVMVVTGANSGIGYQATRLLAARGAHVVMACRNMTKADAATARIRDAHPNASLEVMALDLADLASIRRFAEAFDAAHAHLDVLINNAGVMALPPTKTADGFEMQIGTNHLGHFALTGLLLNRLLASTLGRVVNVSSEIHRVGRINFDDLHGAERYRPWGAYAQSKLANVLFTFELQRRAKINHVPLLAVSCHPGYAATNLQHVGPRLEGSQLKAKLMTLGNRWVAQSAEEGAWPTVYAAVDDQLRGGEYIGPCGPFRLRGRPGVQRHAVAGRDPDVALQLWETSVALTGVHFELLENEALWQPH